MSKRRDRKGVPGEEAESGRRPKSGRGKRSTRSNLGAFLRAQRRIAGLSLRQLAEVTSVSNAYLSQLERDKHSPSIDVLRAIARGLNVSIETILDQVGLFEDPEPESESRPPPLPDTQAAILADPLLSDEQRQALLSVYRSYVLAGQNSDTDER